MFNSFGIGDSEKSRHNETLYLANVVGDEDFKFSIENLKIYSLLF